MSANSKLVEKWIQKTQPECKFIKMGKRRQLYH